MILSNVELFRALDDGRLVIRPEPQPRLSEAKPGESPYGTHSVDLRLGEMRLRSLLAGSFNYDLTQPGRIADTIRHHGETVRITNDQPFCLQPNRFVLGNTLEWVELPIRADPRD